METAEWDIVFDASQRGPEWTFVLIAVIPFAIGWTIWRAADRLTLAERNTNRLVAGGAIAIGLMMLVVGSAPWIRSAIDRDLARAIDMSPVVEGPVENFHPMPPGGHDTERFDVEGVHFEYSGWEISQGFNHDRQHGGPLRDGLYVRIHYAPHFDRQSIMRLAIRRNP